MLIETLQYLGFRPLVDFVTQDNSDGRGIKIVKWLSAEKQPTMQEIEILWPSVQIELSAKELEKRLTDEQQSSAIIEAKRAYARLQNIIDLVDNSTIVQLKSAVKQIAIDVQHLIRASVR